MFHRADDVPGHGRFTLSSAIVTLIHFPITRNERLYVTIPGAQWRAGPPDQFRGTGEAVGSSGGRDGRQPGDPHPSPFPPVYASHSLNPQAVADGSVGCLECV